MSRSVTPLPTSSRSTHENFPKTILNQSSLLRVELVVDGQLTRSYVSGVNVGFADASLRVSFASQISSSHEPCGASHEPLCGTHCGACSPSTDQMLPDEQV